MRRVLMINSAVYLPGEGGYKRSMYLFDLMRKMGYDITLLTGDFNHYSKQVRNVEEFRRKYCEYSGIQILHKMPYKRNISLIRYMSDRVFSRVAAKWIIQHINEFDVVYTSMPDMDIINHISKTCHKKRIPIIVDVRDLHPEALRVVLKKEWLYRICTFFMKKRADKAYASADELLAVSKEYLDRGKKVNPNTPNPTVVYIGAALDRFDDGVERYSSEIIKPKDEVWITYAGTIGASYDLDTVIVAVSKIQKIYGINLRFKILGQGPDEYRLKELIVQQKIENVDFLGFMAYEKMAAYLSKSDITVNCIKKKASQSIINKVADYFACGKPVMNSCLNEEMRWLINHFETGVNYEAENIDEFVKKFIYIFNDKEKMNQYGVNARSLAEKRFDRANSYKAIIEVIDNVKVRHS